MKDIKILEQLLIEKGRIITHLDLKKSLESYKNINNKINLLVKNGWLVNLKKGQYYITKLGSLGYTSISSLIIANQIGRGSFVSFEMALKHHGFFDQSVKKIRSISLKQYQSKKLENLLYQYITVNQNKYFGFGEQTVDGGIALVADKERALIDLIEFQRTANTVSLVLEKLNNHQKDLDFDLLIKYLKNYSQVTIKAFGLLLDLLKLDSKSIQSLVENTTSTARLFKKSDSFNSKWRLYYDDVIINQVL